MKKQHGLYNRFTLFLKRHVNVEENELTRALLLSLAYLCIISAYSLLRSLKSPIFLGMVGIEFQPMSRILALLVIFPCSIGYSKLVDRLKRQQIFFFVIGLYGVLSFVFSFYLAHPDYGISNTTTSPFRILGWLFEIFMDLFSAVVVSTFWSYTNSISTPKFATASYGVIASMSRLGGIFAPLLGVYLLDQSSLPSHISIPLLTTLAGILLLVSIYLIYIINKTEPEKSLHGYEASYEDLKKTSKSKTEKTGVFEGVRLLLTQPYVFGTFGLLFCIEIIQAIFEYQMQVFMSLEMNNNIGSMSSYMFKFTSSFQVVGLIFAIFGTSALLNKIGLQKCLMIVPLATLALSLGVLIFPCLTTMFIVMMVLRALNYSFTVPIREMLYIPTTRDIQFKAKIWIESFGKTFSKTAGTSFNQLVLTVVSNPHIFAYINSVFCIGISAVYGVTSLLIGRTYSNTLRENKVIGHDYTKGN